MAGLQPTLANLQHQVRQLRARGAQLEAENAELREEIASNAALVEERAAHAATKVELEDSRQQLELSSARVNRGIKAFGRDWDKPVVPIVRQPWIEWLQDMQYGLDCMDKAYTMSCKENNITALTQRRSPHALRYVDEEHARRERGPFLDPEENFELDQTFDFQRLIRVAPEVARKIATMTMTKGSIVHFIARLDVTEAYPPQQGGLCQVSNLPMRFWWGPGKDVHINSAPKMSDTLAPLYVCRDFMEIFGTAFFAQNKFSFASFGELHIFRRNTNRAYIERMTNIELWWQGGASRRALNLGLNKEDKKENKKKNQRFDRRTWPLSVLTWMKRLKSLEIYVDESSREAKRRKKEPDFVQEPLAEATSGQDNNRELRDLRKLHGLDYVYQLRGMQRIRVYDSMAEEKRTNVRDQSFVRDMRAETTKPKSRKRARESKIENLSPMARRREDAVPYVSSPQVDWIVRSLLGKAKTADWSPEQGTSPNGNGAAANSGDNGDDDEDNDEDNDEGAGSGKGRGGEGDGNSLGDTQEGDEDSDSESDSDDDGSGGRGSMFVSQVRNPNTVVAQRQGFVGRHYMGRGANGLPISGFGNSRQSPSQSSASQIQRNGLAVGPFVVDESDDDTDEDLIVDEARSAPKFWGTQIDLTDTPDRPVLPSENPLVKDEDKDQDMDDAPVAGPTSNASHLSPPPDENAVKPDDAVAPPPLSDSVPDAQGTDAVPKPDEDTAMGDIYGITPTPAAIAARASPFASLESSDSSNPVFPGLFQASPSEMREGFEDSLAASLDAGNVTPATSLNEAIVIYENEDDDVVFLNSTMAGVSVGEPIKLDDDSDDDLPDIQDVILESLRTGYADSIAAQSDVKIVDLLPGASRQVTPDSFGTPSASRAAAEDDAFNNLNFGDHDSPTPGPGTVTTSDGGSRRGSFTFSDVAASDYSAATSRKRSRDEDGTPTPDDFDEDDRDPKRLSICKCMLGSHNCNALH